MRIARIGVRAFDLPLARPLVVGGRTLTRRSGLLVIAEDAQGHAGIGEASPLPGLHRESFDDAAAQLLSLAAVFEGSALPGGCPALDGAFEAWLGGRGLHPSVRAGVEGAVLSLLAERAGTDVPHLLAPAPARRVLVNGLLDGEAAAVLEEATRLAGEGFAALKIKVGRRDPAAEGRLVVAVRQRVGDRLALRLDANRAWDLPAALAFADLVAGARVAYIEEPVRAPGDLPAFVEAAAVPVALDETLLSRSPASPPPLRGVAALILKPPVLGGFERSMSWARLAQRRRLDAVVSAAFPSAVGLALEAALVVHPRFPSAHAIPHPFAHPLTKRRNSLLGSSSCSTRLGRRPHDGALYDGKAHRNHQAHAA